MPCDDHQNEEQMPFFYQNYYPHFPRLACPRSPLVAACPQPLSMCPLLSSDTPPFHRGSLLSLSLYMRAEPQRSEASALSLTSYQSSVTSSLPAWYQSRLPGLGLDLEPPASSAELEVPRQQPRLFLHVLRMLSLLLIN